MSGYGKAASSGQEEEENGKGTLASLDPTRPGTGYSAVLYNNRSGLPTSEANSIVQTEEGFIWIGSYSGLIRYDGNTFERVNSASGIASVVTLFVDSKNRLWIGTNDSGVVMMERGETKAFRKEQGLKSLSVRAITEDSNGNIYVGTTDGIVEINTALNTRFLEHDEIQDAYIRELRTGGDGVIYGITQEGEFFTIENRRIEKYYNLKIKGMSGVISVLPDPTNPGHVYFGTNVSRIYYADYLVNLNRFDTINVDPLAYINSMYKIDNTLWICAQDGIGLLENGNLRVLDNVPMKSSVEEMMGDYQNNLWFASSRQGVMKITPNRFSDVFEWYGLEETVVNSTCAYDNWLLFGTDHGLTVVNNSEVITKWGIRSVTTQKGRKIRKTDLIELLSGIRIRSIIRDSKNRLWFSTYSDYGLVCYDKGTVTCYTEQDGMPSKRVRAIHECRDGTIWAVCTGGVVLIRDGEIKKCYNENDGILNTEILTVAEAPNGDCVIGTDGGGIYIAGTGRIRCIDTTSGLSSDVIMRIKWDEQRQVFWIVTSNALAYMDKDYHVTVLKGFPYSNNFDIYWNSRGEMWILSSNGIHVITAEELLKNETMQPVLYDWSKGLPHVATSNSYSDLSEDGTLYIAGSDGVTQVNIEEPFNSVNDLKVAVPFIEADGVPIYPDENGNFRVKADVKKVVIFDFVFTYSMSNPQVTYWLEGFDHSMTTVKRTDMTPVSYTNLHGKSYCFKLVVQDSSGVGTKEYSVIIVKNKMFYEYGWFQALAVILAILLTALAVWLFVRRKIKQLEKKEEEQRIFINEMIEAFAKTIDMKDSYTNGHSFRVAKYTALLATELGCSEEEVEKFHNIALLHDIGKIGVEDKVLKKEGKLEDDEFMQIKSHTSLGYNVLKDISIMPELAIGAGAHHERPDGKGYPNGLKADEIPRVAQIIAVADCFDAMYSDRPYRKRMNFEKAVSIIKGAAGSQLFGDVVEAFLRLVDKGEFRAPDDDGQSGTTEDIDNIHKREAEEAKEQKEAEAKKEAEVKKEAETKKAEEAGTEKTDAAKTEAEDKKTE
ncbi:MAG: HD domain-containing protein [Lachnospiraceae bacterium]|nr:HD domain-containing protein [Lachnospiraceae bacterium]